MVHLLASERKNLTQRYRGNRDAEDISRFFSAALLLCTSA
jgi:hypothetical protein